MYPISFIGKKQIKTEHFCVNHKLNLTRQEAWESVLRLLAFPGTLLNMVESSHAGQQLTLSLFLGMALTDLGDLGGWGAALDAGAGGEWGAEWPGLSLSSSAHLSWARAPVRESSCLQALRRIGLPWTPTPKSSNTCYQATLPMSRLNPHPAVQCTAFCSALSKDGEQLVSIPCRRTLQTLESHY